MKNYICPKIKSFSSVDLIESTGPVQTANYAQMTFEGWKGAFLYQSKDYRYCKINKNEEVRYVYRFVNNEIKRG